MGTREHIIAYLSEADELFDANGMASTQLAAAVGYPGSSVAFAQLLSGMERSGLIEREVRGKRTYRISLGPAPTVGLGGAARVPAGVAAGVAGVARASGAGVVGGGAGDEAGFDYDELARRLLVQVVRRLAAADPGYPDRSAGDRSAPDRSAPDRSAPDRSAPDRSAPDRSAPDRSALQETVTGLEYELAAAWTKHGKLAEENVRLREQLKAAQRSLAQAAERIRRLPVSSDLDSSEVVLLQRLLASGGADSPDPSDSGREGLEEARSLLS